MSEHSLLAQAERMDKQDPLAPYQQRFELPSDTVYLDGNSLGPLTSASKARAKAVVEQQWGRDLITSWNAHKWIELPTRVGEKIAPLIGAASGQVVCCDSTSVNIFKLLCGAIAMQPERHVVLTTDDNFPTDRYMIEGIQRLHPQLDMLSVDENDILSRIDSSIAVMLLTQVNYRTGKRLNMQEITRKAHEHGVLVIWDLAHSAGVIDIQLDECDVDFAVGCGYKYLNGGPGAPAFLYVAKRHQPAFKQPLQGWMGHSAPFTFDPHYQPSQSIQHNLVGTPNVLSMSVLDAALDIFVELPMEAVEAKALGLREWFATLLNECDVVRYFDQLVCHHGSDGGAQLALHHKDAYAICQALIDVGVIADFRAPDILRIGFSPLFLTYKDLLVAVERLSDIMVNNHYKQPRYHIKQAVT
ncbi:kynureninase [Alteromonas facilis]|uniref:kynureninase n=1 Tax=Alteromonas facilis TaxID=2048004 RepID=UPI000C284189|nr:kynureninase [Alteromonas facilis]